MIQIQLLHLLPRTSFESSLHFQLDHRCILGFAICLSIAMFGANDQLLFFCIPLYFLVFIFFGIVL